MSDGRGIIGAALSKIGEGLADVGKTKQRDEVQARRDAIAEKRQQNLLRLQQEFQTSERVEGQDFRAEESLKAAESRERIADIKSEADILKTSEARTSKQIQQEIGRGGKIIELGVENFAINEEDSTNVRALLNDNLTSGRSRDAANALVLAKQQNEKLAIIERRLGGTATEKSSVRDLVQGAPDAFKSVIAKRFPNINFNLTKKQPVTPKRPIAQTPTPQNQRVQKITLKQLEDTMKARNLTREQILKRFGDSGITLQIE